VGPPVSDFNRNRYAQLSTMAQQHCPVQIPPYPYSVQQQISPLGQMPVVFGTPISSTPSSSGSISEFSHNVRSPTVDIRPLVDYDDMVYQCNIILQLRGNYEVKTPEGQVQVSVIEASKDDGVKPFAIVRRSRSDGEALSDKVIHEEPHRFTLLSMNGKLEGTLRKGVNIKSSVRWENAAGGAPTIWERKGEVIFRLVQVDSLHPGRLNVSGLGETLSPSGTSSFGYPLSSIPKSIPPGQFYQNYHSRMGTVPTHPSASHASNKSPSLCGKRVSNANDPSVESYTKEPINPCDGSDARNVEENLQNPAASAAGATCTEQQQALVELMKAHCVRKPDLLKRLVHWGMRTAASPTVSSKIADHLSKGRLWVTAFPAEEGDIEMSLQENLEDIKGAYRQVTDGVWKQPEPQASEPGVQHRLLKSPGGQWKIEAQDFGSGGWQLCAQELPDGRWLDMKNNRKEIVVYLISMNKILRKLSEVHSATSLEVEKCMEFLFKSCNQKKLNSKLKGRNLRHNIDNLKVKLEKQYSLCFAVQVASVADSIAKERDSPVRSDQFKM